MQETATAPAGRLATPATGELVELDAPDERLAAAIDESDQLVLRLRLYRQRLGEELLRRMDRAACWTLRAGELTVAGESPDRVDYDAGRLAAALGALTDEGAISAAAAGAALKRKTEPMPQKRGIYQLRKRGGRIRELIDGCQLPVLRPRRVTVSRRQQR
jgi:hypothetical protein